jgi:hypothetical protein
MKRFRVRLSSLLWLVVFAAVFLAGVRYGEYRAESNRQSVRGYAIRVTSDHPKLTPQK